MGVLSCFFYLFFNILSLKVQTSLHIILKCFFYDSAAQFYLKKSLYNFNISATAILIENT